MNIYMLSQDENTGYDTYDSCIVVAESEEQARQINPDFGSWNDPYSYWAKSPADVKVELIGKADNKFTEQKIILASFNAE